MKKKKTAKKGKSDELTIYVGGHSYKVRKFRDGEVVNIQSLLKIDISNLIGELATFPIILNRIGLVLAEFQEKVELSELSYNVWRSKYEEKVRKKYSKKNPKEITVKGLETSVRNNKEYEIRKSEIARAKKNYGIINSIYWAAKDKSDNLKKLSLTLTPEDRDEDSLKWALNRIEIVESGKNVLIK